MLRDQRNLNTRLSQHAVMVPRVKHSGADSFVYTASKQWNSLPPNLQSTQSKYDFKTAVKSCLYSKYENSYFNPLYICKYCYNATYDSNSGLRYILVILYLVSLIFCHLMWSTI